jgi:hypothetical protein
MQKIVDATAFSKGRLRALNTAACKDLAVGFSGTHNVCFMVNIDMLHNTNSVHRLLQALQQCRYLPELL